MRYSKRQKSLSVREVDRKGKTAGERKSQSMLPSEASHLYCQSPLLPVTRGLNETRPSRSSMLSSVSSSATITLDLLNRHQTFSHGALETEGLVEDQGLLTARRPCKH